VDRKNGFMILPDKHGTSQVVFIVIWGVFFVSDLIV